MVDRVLTRKYEYRNCTTVCIPNLVSLNIMADTHSHHLIYGTLFDYLTNEELTDTDDERLRQQLAQLMVEKRGYTKAELTPRLYIETLFTRHFVRSTIDLTITLEGKQCLILRYGPGSLVSRERAAIAAARVLNPVYSIPLAIVTNARDAELIDTQNGNILDTGMEAIPNREALLTLLPDLSFPPRPEDVRLERELRILNAFDIERCCL